MKKRNSVYGNLLVSRTLGISRKEKAGNESIKEWMDVLNTSNIIEYTETKPLKWYGHVQNMGTERWLK